MAKSHPNEPFLSFAALSDIQYGDFEDGYNFRKTRKRYYRNSLEFQKKVVNQWKEMSPQVEFIINLGDIIDGFNKRHGISQSSLDRVLKAFEKFRVYYIIGNHELYNFNREELINSPLYLNGLKECQDYPAPSGAIYYTFLPHSSFRIIVLDSYEISVIGWPESSSNYQLAMKYLENNVNENKASSENMVGVNKRFCQFNGGMTDEQLNWLEKLLKQSQEMKENVLIMGHLPILSPPMEPCNLLFNYDELLNLLHKYSCVIGYLSGHDHEGGFGVDDHNLPHLTFPAILETAPCDEPPVATLHLYSDNLQLKGQGKIKDVDFKLKFPIKY